MKYYVETSLENFEAWSGGRDTLEVLIEKGLCDTVEACLEEILDGDVYSGYSVEYVRTCGGCAFQILCHSIKSSLSFYRPISAKSLK